MKNISSKVATPGSAAGRIEHLRVGALTSRQVRIAEHVCTTSLPPVDGATSPHKDPVAGKPAVLHIGQRTFPPHRGCAFFLQHL